MEQKVRPVYLVEAELDRIEALGNNLRMTAKRLTPEQLVYIGNEIATLARQTSDRLWGWDDPDGRLMGGHLNNCEMVYSTMPVPIPIDCPFT